MLFASHRNLKLLSLLFLLSLLLATLIQYTERPSFPFHHSIHGVLDRLSSTPVDSEPAPFTRARTRRTFLPPSHYQRDHAGAIDVFEKGDSSICRIYRVCRLKNGQVYYPRWMKSHLSLLKQKCGLHDLHFAPSKSLKNEFGISIYFDWLGPNMPTPTLLKFVNNPLSYFFASKRAQHSLLGDNSTPTLINRTCIAAPSEESGAEVSVICGSRAEGRIAHPAVVINTDSTQPKAHSDFYNSIRRTYQQHHGETITILDPDSRALNRPKLCFRSVIASGTADYLAGFTSRSTTETPETPDNVPALQWSFKDDMNVSSHTFPAKNETHSFELVKKQSLTGIRKPHNHNATMETLPTFEEFEATKLQADHNESDTTVRLETEGGVELFTHRAVDGLQWNKSHTGQPSEHVYGICRVYRACLQKDRSIVLPTWMNHSAVSLKNHCGIEAITFVQDDEFDLMFENIKLSSRNKRVANPVASQPDMEVLFDLIGTREYRTQKHHFVTDFLHDGIHAMDALYNRDDTGLTSFRRKCIYRPDSNVAKEAHELGTCAHGPMKVDDLKPVFLLDKKFRASSIHGKFIRQLAAMMPPKDRKGPEFIRASEMSKSGYKQSTCFRSIVVTRNAYPPSSVLEAAEKNIFFTQNNISREVLKPIVKGECKVRVALIPAQKQRKANIWAKGEGELVNEDDIISAIKTVGRSIAEQGASNVTIEVVKVKRIGHDLLEDQKMIQESGVIISPNNPSLTSMMFARPHTLLVEVQPFSYAAGPYRSFAGTFKLGYRSIMANPDYETFKKCINDNFKMDWARNVSEEELVAHKEGLLKLYREARDRFDGTVSELHLEHREFGRGEVRKHYIPKERVCARAQRLKIDANRAAVIVGKHVADLCQRHAKHTSTLEAVL